MTNETNYEKIQSLAKQEYERRVKEYQITDVEEILYQSDKYLQADIKGKQKYIATKVFKPVLQKFSEDPEGCVAYINRYCGDGEFGIQIEIDTEEREKCAHIIGVKHALGDLLKITFVITQGTRTAVYGFAGDNRYGTNVIGREYPDINIVDLSDFLAGMYLYCEVVKVLRNLQTISRREREDNRYYQGILDYFREYQQKRSLDFEMPYEQMERYCRELEERASIRKQRKRQGKSFSESMYRMIGECTNFQRFVQYLYYMFLRMMENEVPLFTYLDFVNYSVPEGRGWKVVNGLNPYQFLESVVNLSTNDRGVIVQNHKSYKMLDSEYTKSFQTKKNQSEKLKKEIAKSRLWKYFGYVEYDESVDLQAIARYEEEFEGFYARHLEGLDLSGDAVRFRKLGQHKAGGLYYPQVKCLCVDIHYPDSMVHELGHLIDYQLGGLSSQTDFMEIYAMTRAHLEECEEAGDALAKQLKGKTKYNKEYFLCPTEVFARAFELYVHYIWKERTSLQQREFDQIYDCSEDNLRRVKEYFDRVLDWHSGAEPV